MTESLLICTKCEDLVKTRRTIVAPIKVGNNPVILFIGEAPGSTEDKRGLPFCGPAGKYHQWFVSQINVESFVVGNCINCRPTKINNLGHVINGKPTESNLKNCCVWLQKVVNLYPYKLIVLYGEYPMRAMLGVNPPVSNNVGKFYDVDGRTFFACYHPATLIYNYKEYIEKWTTHAAMIREHLSRSTAI